MPLSYIWKLLVDSFCLYVFYQLLQLKNGASMKRKKQANKMLPIFIESSVFWLQAS